jgi:ribosomal protein S27E
MLKDIMENELIINFRDLPKEVREEKRSEKNSMQRRLLKNENRLKQFALEHSSKPVACEICGKSIDTNTLSSFQVHAELHSFDENEYFVRKNLHIVCSANCHGKYRNERYRLSDGNIYEYDKFERYKD